MFIMLFIVSNFCSSLTRVRNMDALQKYIPSNRNLTRRYVEFYCQGSAVNTLETSGNL